MEEVYKRGKYKIVLEESNECPSKWGIHIDDGLLQLFELLVSISVFAVTYLLECNKLITSIISAPIYVISSILIIVAFVGEPNKVFYLLFPKGNGVKIKYILDNYILYIKYYKFTEDAQLDAKNIDIIIKDFKKSVDDNCNEEDLKLQKTILLRESYEKRKSLMESDTT